MAGVCCSRAAITLIASTCMFNLKIFKAISTEVLSVKNDLELNTEIQLINKYKTAKSDAYKEAIVYILKDRGYTRLEIGQLLA